MSDIFKALESFEKDVNVANYAGPIPSSLLARQDLEAAIVKLTNRATPLRDVVSRVKGDGRAHLWNQRTQLDPSAASLTVNAFYADGALPTQSDGTYVQKTAAYKYLGYTGVVTGPMVASGRSFTDILAEIAEARLREVIQAEEWAMFHGNSTTNALMFDGLDAQLTTNLLDKAGAAIAITDIWKIIKNIRNQGGISTHIFCSFGVQNQINSLLLGDSRVVINQGTTVTAGVNVNNIQTPVGALPLVGDFFINPASPYPYNSAGTSSGTSGSSTSNMYVLQVPEIEMVDLMPIGRTELAKIADTVRFYINEYTVMAVKAEPWQGVIQNISDPTS